MMISWNKDIFFIDVRGIQRASVDSLHKKDSNGDLWCSLNLVESNVKQLLNKLLNKHLRDLRFEIQLRSLCTILMIYFL